MKQLRIGDITIDAVIEREGPWRRPQDFFPAYDDAVFKHHLPGMEPEVYDSALGMMVITYQTFVVARRATPFWSIPAPARTRAIRRRSIFPARSAGATSCLRSASPTSRSITCSAPICTSTTPAGIPRCATVAGCHVSQCQVHISQEGIRGVEAENAKGANPPGTVFRDNCLPIVEAGQALLVDDDYALDDTVTLTPTPGHSPCHCCVNIFSKGKRAVVAGDLMHHAIQCREPEWSAKPDWDTQSSQRSRGENSLRPWPAPIR